jgi:phospholipid-transporting ATPase
VQSFFLFQIAEACSTIERNLHLIGATAIEDRLAEGVPECIAQLRKANIKVWVLTGDKMETAVNVGHSCNLLNKGMTLFTLNETSLDRVRDVMCRFKHEVSQATSQDTPCGLIVDGRALHYALSMDLRKDFLDLATTCKAVICCRASPMQKADVVSLVRVNNPRDITLASKSQSKQPSKSTEGWPLLTKHLIDGFDSVQFSWIS